jgi:hypothetical protein
MDPAELVRRSWDAETRRQLTNLLRSLHRLNDATESVIQRVDGGDRRVADDLRRMLADAVDAAQSAAALEAGDHLSFAVDQQP